MKLKLLPFQETVVSELVFAIRYSMDEVALAGVVTKPSSSSPPQVLGRQ